MTKLYVEGTALQRLLGKRNDIEVEIIGRAASQVVARLTSRVDTQLGPARGLIQKIVDEQIEQIGSSTGVMNVATKAVIRSFLQDELDETMRHEIRLAAKEAAKEVLADEFEVFKREIREMLTKRADKEPEAAPAPKPISRERMIRKREGRGPHGSLIRGDK